MTDEEMIYIMRKPCYYTGKMDACGFNGLDRLDSSKGYHIDNVVSCQSAVNYAKVCSDPVSFVEQVLCIHTFRATGEVVFPESFGKPMKVSSLRAYFHRDKNRDRECKISKEKHKQLEQGEFKCDYTGLVATSWDRIDTTLPYSDENIQPVVGVVNLMRHKLTIAEFDQLIADVVEHVTKSGLYEKLVSMDIPRCPEKKVRRVN